MTNVLVLRNSILGSASASNELVDQVLETVGRTDRATRVVVRDLTLNPVPHLGVDAAAALRVQTPENGAQAKAKALSDLLISELAAADLVVIGAPMYNFGMPSTLKSWFDYVLRAGVTFSYTEAGPVGLMTGKRAVVVLTRGGIYREHPASTMDSQEPHIRNLLAFMGITDVLFVHAEGLAIGPEARRIGMEYAQDTIERELGNASYPMKAAS